MGHGEERIRSSYAQAGGALVLLILVLASCWRCLHLPFIQDDWAVQLEFVQRGWSGVLDQLGHLRGALFFRPLSVLYLYGLHRLLGLRPAGYHLAALLIHAATAWLVVQVVERLVRDRLVAFAAGVLYALALPICLECLMWVVGIVDLGAALFTLLALLLFLGGRPLASALAYLAACLFKEVAIVLPALLAGLALAGYGPTDRRLRRLAPHALVLVVVCGIRLLGASPFAFSDTHPYAVRFTGRHVAENAVRYLAWLGQSFFPLVLSADRVGRLVSAVAVLALFGLGLVHSLRRMRGERRLLVVLGLWTALPLCAVVFLPNHCYRYYAIHAVPPFVTGLLLCTRELLGACTRHVRPILIGMVLVSAALSWRAGAIMLSEGRNQHSFAGGTNSLVLRAAVVELVRDGLRELLPAPPPRTAILLGGADIWAFGKNSGPRLWYGRDDLQVYPLEAVRRDGSGLYVQDPVEEQEQIYTGPESRRRSLADVPLRAFRLENKLVAVELESIPGAPGASTGE
jgi:hypothetical protein